MSKSCTIGNPFSCNDMYSPIGRGKLVKTKKYKSWIEKNLPLIKNNLSLHISLNYLLARISCKYKKLAFN